MGDGKRHVVGLRAGKPRREPPAHLRAKRRGHEVPDLAETAARLGREATRRKEAS